MAAARILNVSPLPNKLSSTPEWVRETTDDGRVYYFNRSTGASQWHIPNELYKPKCLAKGTGLEVHETTKMPGSARAMLGVDCMTESSLPAHAEMKQKLVRTYGHSKTFEGGAIEGQDEEHLVVERVLRVFIHKARGLRDTDFMPGADKSDPYCRCDIPGKPHLNFKTKVVPDCLDPVWNHEEIVCGFEEGDTLQFSVWDYDEPAQDHGVGQSMGQSVYASCDDDNQALWMDGDELLGRCSIIDDEVIRCGSGEYRLEDSGHDEDEEEDCENPKEAFLSVDTQIVLAWPSLLGTKAEDVAMRLKKEIPGLSVQLFEMPHEASKVVAVDTIYAKEGYKGKFFGVPAEAAEILQEGSVVSVGGQRLTVADIGPVKEDPRRPSVRMRYVFLDSAIQGVIRADMNWQKVTRKPEPSYRDGRVCIWYDFATGLVARVPHIG